MLQGFPEYQTDEIPTWALFKPSSVMPVAYNMAWEAPCDLGWVMAAETLLSFGSESLARKEDVEERDRLGEGQLSFMIQVQSTYTYCEALLELHRDAFARSLNCGRSMFAVMPIKATVLMAMPSFQAAMLDYD
jgi:hypothetical protein